MDDVCVILEGSYPYATGGVSAWVDGLISGLDDVSFSLVHLRDGDDPPGAPTYKSPANLGQVLTMELDPDRDDPQDGIESLLPEASVYHSLSTGAAGLVGVRAAAAQGRPFVLTEHGISWREARIGIAACKPQGCKPQGCKPQGQRPEGQPLRGRARREAAARWAVTVEEQAREAYAGAAAIATVCSENVRLQQLAGAPSERLHLIPNSTTPQARREADAGKKSRSRFRVGLVGRVVAIKDVTGFIHACAVLADRIPEAEFVVVGPLDHEPEYAADCFELVARLGLEEKLTFTGETDPALWYPRLDVLALTSISEAQPLVLLEAMTAGIPVVATAVGGCPELIGGPQPAGLLVTPREPAAVADAVACLWRDPALARGLGSEGRRRARGIHAPSRLTRAYRHLYESAIAAPA